MVIRAGLPVDIWWTHLPWLPCLPCASLCLVLLALFEEVMTMLLLDIKEEVDILAHKRLESYDLRNAFHVASAEQ